MFRTPAPGSEEAKLKARLKKLEADRKAEEEKIRILVGEAVMKRADRDREFAAKLKAIVDEETTSARNRKTLGLDDPKSSATTGQSAAHA